MNNKVTRVKRSWKPPFWFCFLFALKAAYFYWMKQPPFNRKLSSQEFFCYFIFAWVGEQLCESPVALGRLSQISQALKGFLVEPKALIIWSSIYFQWKQQWQILNPYPSRFSIVTQKQLALSWDKNHAVYCWEILLSFLIHSFICQNRWEKQNVNCIISV